MKKEKESKYREQWVTVLRAYTHTTMKLHQRQAKYALQQIGSSLHLTNIHSFLFIPYGLIAIRILKPQH